MDLLAEIDPRPVQADIPGLHQDAVPAHGFELWTDKPIGVGALEALKQAFDWEGAMVAAHVEILGCLIRGPERIRVCAAAMRLTIYRIYLYEFDD